MLIFYYHVQTLKALFNECAFKRKKQIELLIEAFNPLSINEIALEVI